MAGTTDAGFNITHLLPIELLQKVFRFSKLMEPPVFPDTTDGTHEFKLLWAWPVSVKRREICSDPTRACTGLDQSQPCQPSLERGTSLRKLRGYGLS